MRCGNCGLRLERGEHDYFTGSLMFNYIIAGVLFVASLAAVLIWTWPNVPWDTLQWLAPVLMLAAPAVIFPFSKLTWLAFDLMFRPVTPEELEWHRGAETEWTPPRAPGQ